MSKVEPLLRAQSESFFEFFGYLPGKGWKPDQLKCDPKRGLVLATENGEDFALYSQGWADEHVWKVFQMYAQMLPESFTVRQLTIDRVGALATLRLSAFVGMTTDPQQDFVAMSIGICARPSGPRPSPMQWVRRYI